MNSDDQKYWDLIAGKLQHELTDEEDESFDRGMSESSIQANFAKSQRIHNGLKEIKELNKADQQSSWSYILRQIKTRKIETIGLSLLKYAAILVLAFLAGNYFHSQSITKQEVQYAEMEVMQGQIGHLFLFDGTEVWLNSGSKFKYPNQFNRNERNVSLEGEAYFKVTPNKHLPFKVKTGKLEIEVLGTSFNVSAYPNENNQSVVLVEGKVKLNDSTGNKLGEMSPGQMAFRSDDGVTKFSKVDTYYYTSWKEGKVKFNGENLGEIAKKIERWYNVEIRFENEKLKKYEFSGTILRNKPIDQTIMAMEQLAPIHFNYISKTQEKNVIIIARKK